MSKVTKSFAVFDCDAHINDPEKIWDYVPESKKDLVRQTYWRDDTYAWLNGDTAVMGGGNGCFAPGYNPICIAGPQMNKRIMRKLNTMSPLTPEQRAYVHHDGALDPHARIKEMDLMGIDQVLVIPTMVIMHLPFATNAEGVDAFCRAYNNFLVDWCGEERGRLWGAALLPIQDPAYTVAEIHRAAALGHPVGLIRPIDAEAKYPNSLAPAMMAGGDYDAVFRAFEETGMVLGMHTFPAPSYPHPLGSDYLASPGELFSRAGTDSQTFSFIHEMQVWLAQVLLSGFLDRYPRLKMAVFESNAEWLPYALDSCDRLYKLYARERRGGGTRLPSEAFKEQCVISFESDETGLFRQWQDFEKIGIWASDAYHHDGADSWSAIRNMTSAGVPAEVQSKLLGENARSFYGIEPKLFVTEEPDPIQRPDWFPQGPELEAWADIVAHPRENAEKVRELGLDPDSFLGHAAAMAASAGQGGARY
jgi:predicted TIM-barrel fold metal-dependent hydrolase